MVYVTQVYLIQILKLIKKMNENSPKKGLGGWLILIGIGVVLSPIRLSYFLFKTVLPIFTNGTWEALTNEESISYNPSWGYVIIFELVFNVAMLLWLCYLIYLFFTKHYRFPLMYILIAGASVIFIIIDELVCAAVFTNQPFFDSETLKALSRSLFALIIWGLYLFKSERSRLTFIEKKTNMISDNDVILDN
jgi:hypothetical protein